MMARSSSAADAMLNAGQVGRLLKERNLTSKMGSLGLEDRAWMILEMRVGFNERRTLQAIADELRVSRQRVEQIQRKSIKKIMRGLHRVKPALDDLEESIGSLWQPFQDVNIEDAIKLLGDALAGCGWQTAEVNSIRRLLVSIRAIVDAKKFEKLGRWPELTLAVCSLPPPVKRHPIVAAALHRREREAQKQQQNWTYGELAEYVLQEAGKPLHWREIATRAEALGRRASFSASSLYNAINSRSRLFVRVGPGTYGLAAWGLTPVEDFDDIAAEILNERGSPMSFGALWHAVNARRAAKKNSLKMMLDLNVRFYRSVNNLYGLRIWLPPRDKQTLRTPRELVEDRKSYDRVSRAVGQGYDVERIIMEDIMKFRKGSIVQ